MYCKRCGLKLPQDAAFCPKCGMNLTDNGVSLSAPPAPPPNTFRCPRCNSYNIQAHGEKKAFNPYIIIVTMVVSVVLIPMIAVIISALVADATVQGTAVLDAIYSAAFVSVPTGLVLGIIISIAGCVRRSRTYDTIFVCQDCGCVSHTR
jgi:hypothetical protein